MFEITNRSCVIGNHVNVRSEKQGSEDVDTAFDIMLDDISLSPSETNTLLCDDKAYDCLFRPRPGEHGLDGMLVPTFPKVTHLPIAEKIEGARVQFNLGSGRPLTLNDCTLARLAVRRTDGGLCVMKVQVQCIPNIDEGGARLLKRLGDKVTVNIRAEVSDQQTLPLKEGDKEETRKVSGGFRPSKTGEQIDEELRARAKSRKANGHGNVTQLPARSDRKQIPPPEPPPTSEPPPAAE
jgi:hypothetical protein